MKKIKISTTKKLHELYAQIAKSITISLQAENIATSIMIQIEHYFKPDNWSLFQVDSLSNELYFVVAKGLDMALLKPIRIKQGEGIVGLVAQSREPMLIVDVRNSIYFSPKMDELTGFITQSVLAVPIVYQTQVLGVIELINVQDGRVFSEKELDILQTIADFAAIALNNANIYKRIKEEVTRREESEKAMLVLHDQMLVVSREVGMAEIATNILHNVGNVLNTVNVSASVVVETMQASDVTKLARVVSLIHDNEADIGRYLTEDLKGKHLLDYLFQFSERLESNQKVVFDELHTLQKNIEHIRKIVSSQQTYAGVSAKKELVDMGVVIEESLHLSDVEGVEVVREIGETPKISLDKHRVLQILVNLLNNAKAACEESGNKDPRVILRILLVGQEIKVYVQDNGLGIPKENLTQIFNHGFTTKEDGHGFGLHGAALAAKEVGGTLEVQSEGLGQGATFILSIPCNTARDHKL